jgi:hypothetical protein
MTQAENPYRSPNEIEGDEFVAEAIPYQGYDPLAMPAALCALLGVCGSMFTGGVFAMGVLHWLSGADMGDFHFLALSFAFAQSFAMFVAARWCLMRRRRWYVLWCAIFGLVGCTPLGALLLLRLRRKEVWMSFMD